MNTRDVGCVMWGSCAIQKCISHLYDGLQICTDQGFTVRRAGLTNTHRLSNVQRTSLYNYTHPKSKKKGFCHQTTVMLHSLTLIIHPYQLHINHSPLCSCINEDSRRSLWWCFKCSFLICCESVLAIFHTSAAILCKINGHFVNLKPKSSHISVSD